MSGIGKINYAACAEIDKKQPDWVWLAIGLYAVLATIERLCKDVRKVLGAHIRRGFHVPKEDTYVRYDDWNNRHVISKEEFDAMPNDACKMAVPPSNYLAYSLPTLYGTGLDLQRFTVTGDSWHHHHESIDIAKMIWPNHKDPEGESQ